MIHFKHSARYLAVVVVAGLLAGCATRSAVDSSEAFHIASVEMMGAPPAGGSAFQLQDLRAKTMAEAARAPETANPRALHLEVVHYRKKNPGMSFLIGDANSLRVAGEVVEPENGTVIGRFNTTVLDDYVINGVVGAAIAASEESVTVEKRLNSKAARNILEHVYGSKTWKRVAGAPDQARALSIKAAPTRSSPSACGPERRAAGSAEVAITHCVAPVGQDIRDVN